MWECKRCGAEQYRVLRSARMIGGANMEARECNHCQHVTYSAATSEHQQGVTYEQPTPGGARCPGCGRQPVPVARTMKVVSGVRIRYHRCKYCGWTGKSIERV